MLQANTSIERRIILEALRRKVAENELKQLRGKILWREIARGQVVWGRLQQCLGEELLVHLQLHDIMMGRQQQCDC